MAEAWLVTDGEPSSANSLVVATPEGVPVMADTPWTPAATRELLDWIELRFGQPPGLATISHWHFDAAGGLSALRLFLTCDRAKPTVEWGRKATVLSEILWLFILHFHAVPNIIFGGSRSNLQRSHHQDW